MPELAPVMTTVFETKALEVPDHQVRGELRARLFERAEAAAIYERAIGSATKIDETQADVESGQPFGGGMALRYSIAPRGEPWSIGLDLEVMRWSVPYTEIRTCVENCEGVAGQQTIHGESGEMTWGFGVTPAFRLDGRHRARRLAERTRTQFMDYIGKRRGAC